MSAKKRAEKKIERENAAKIQQLQGIMDQLDAEFRSLLQTELSQLEILSRFTESVEEKLKKHYADIFPKKCNNCQTIYKTLEAYLQATSRLAKTTTVFDEVGLQEYRNCPCGSTLIVWTDDRRDNSDYGKRRRELFEKCLTKLEQVSGPSLEEARANLRKVFSYFSS